MTILFAKWQVKDGHLQAVLDVLPELVKQTTAEKGNVFYKIHQSNTDANTLVLFEGYEDDSALEAHRNSVHFQTLVIGKVVPLLAAREAVVATELNFG